MFLGCFFANFGTFSSTPTPSPSPHPTPFGIRSGSKVRGHFLLKVGVGGGG